MKACTAANCTSKLATSWSTVASGPLPSASVLAQAHAARKPAQDYPPTPYAAKTLRTLRRPSRLAAHSL